MALNGIKIKWAKNGVKDSEASSREQAEWIPAVFGNSGPETDQKQMDTWNWQNTVRGKKKATKHCRKFGETISNHISLVTTIIIFVYSLVVVVMPYVYYFSFLIHSTNVYERMCQACSIHGCTRFQS